MCSCLILECRCFSIPSHKFIQNFCCCWHSLWSCVDCHCHSQLNAIYGSYFKRVKKPTNESKRNCWMIIFNKLLCVSEEGNAIRRQTFFLNNYSRPFAEGWRCALWTEEDILKLNWFRIEKVIILIPRMKLSWGTWCTRFNQIKAKTNLYVSTGDKI